MEFLDGQSLADRIAKGPMPLRDALECAAQVADALSKAHRQGIVHRDIKPGNVILTKEGAKLLDFGLAKARPAARAIETEATRTVASFPASQAGIVVGTVPYMAPEQLEGCEADARTDIFAFGAMLYEMLCGRRAFHGESQASIIAGIMTGDPAPLIELPTHNARLGRASGAAVPCQGPGQTLAVGRRYRPPSRGHPGGTASADIF